MSVVIIGGGIIGLACAWRLAQRGSPVTVVDPAPGRGASHVAAGMLAPATEASFTRPDKVTLDLAAAARWPAFASELETAADQPVGFRSSGTLVVARDADDRRVLDRLYDFQRDLGLTVERLTRQACRMREPELHPRIAGGLVAHADHHVNSREVVAALLTVLDSLDVEVVEDTVTELTHSGGRATGVRLAGGAQREAATVVLAAGFASGRISGLPDEVRPSVRGVKGQILRLRSRDGDPVVSSTVRGVAHGDAVYLVPRGDGRVVVGATEEDVGDDVTVTAGGIRTLLDAAVALVPAVDELELVEASARLRPATADGLPYIGWSDLEGLLLATGHHRGGILLAPYTAEVVADLVAGDTTPDAAAAIADPRRAAGPAPTSILRSVS